MNKIYGLGQLVKKANYDRRLVLTHGTFDFFHAGHISFLKNSSKYGCRLAVGIDSDRHTVGYKTRYSVFNQKKRLAIISELECVDYAFLIDTDDKNFFVKLYKALRPDLITHGRDFSCTTKAKREANSLGIPSKLVEDDYAGRLSTSYYINKIVDLYR